MFKILHSNDFDIKRVFCGLPFTKMVLNSWGNVSMCCHQVTPIGILTEDVELLDLWNNDVANQIRKETEEGNLHLICKNGNCPFLTSEKYFITHFSRVLIFWLPYTTNFIKLEL